MYTIKDLASNKFILLSESNLLEVENINSITVSFIKNKRKIVKIHIGLYEFLFGKSFKNLLKLKLRNDLGGNFDIEFKI